MSVDVVYPLTDASKRRDDFELRYSLRALAKQSWVRNVYLIGHRPKWVVHVRHEPCEDPFTPKDANIINKILLACSLPELSDTFVVNSDDQYIMRPVTLEELGPWVDPAALPHAKARLRHSRWCQRVMGTLDVCRKNGLPAFLLDSHVPYPVERKEYQRVFSEVAWARGNGFTTHLYFNATMDEPPPEIAPGLALHAITPMKTIPEPPPAFFNHTNAGLSPFAREWLEATFPDPSPWET